MFTFVVVLSALFGCDAGRLSPGSNQKISPHACPYLDVVLVPTMVFRKLTFFSDKTKSEIYCLADNGILTSICVGSLLESPEDIKKLNHNKIFLTVDRKKKGRIRDVLNVLLSSFPPHAP